MSWPPDQWAWNKILKNLPPGANRQRFGYAVDAAVQGYLASDGLDSERWQRIHKLTKSKAVIKLCDEIGQLKTPWGFQSMAERSVAAWAKDLLAVIEIAEFEALRTKTKNQGRRER